MVPDQGYRKRPISEWVGNRVISRINYDQCRDDEETQRIALDFFEKQIPQWGPIFQCDSFASVCKSSSNSVLDRTQLNTLMKSVLSKATQLGVKFGINLVANSLDKFK